MIPKPIWSHPPTTSPSDDETWPTNLMDIIRAIKSMPPRRPTQPEFTFDLTPEAAAKNYLVLMKKYIGDLGALLEVQRNSIVGYGSEFRDVDTLRKIFGWHPNWTRLSKILENGSEWPLEPLDEELRCDDVDTALAFGNHKGVSLQPDLLQKLVSKDVHFGYCLPLPLDKAQKIPGTLLAPMNIQKQNTINEYGRIIEKDRLTHDQSNKWLSGTSFNSRVITEELGGPYSTSMDPCTTPPEVPSLLPNASQAMNSPKTLLRCSTTKTSDLDENQGKHCNDIPLDHMPTADKLAALRF